MTDTNKNTDPCTNRRADTQKHTHTDTLTHCTDTLNQRHTFDDVKSHLSGTPSLTTTCTQHHQQQHHHHHHHQTAVSPRWRMHDNGPAASVPVPLLPSPTTATPFSHTDVTLISAPYTALCPSTHTPQHTHTHPSTPTHTVSTTSAARRAAPFFNAWKNQSDWKDSSSTAPRFILPKNCRKPPQTAAFSRSKSAQTPAGKLLHSLRSALLQIAPYSYV